MKEFYLQSYPSDLVHQKIFEVTFELSERLHLVSKQAVVSAEMLASETLKRTQQDYADLKKEIAEERDRSRDTRHGLDT